MNIDGLAFDNSRSSQYRQRLPWYRSIPAKMINTLMQPFIFLSNFLVIIFKIALCGSLLLVLSAPILAMALNIEFNYVFLNIYILLLIFMCYKVYQIYHFIIENIEIYTPRLLNWIKHKIYRMYYYLISVFIVKPIRFVLKIVLFVLIYILMHFPFVLTAIIINDTLQLKGAWVFFALINLYLLVVAGIVVKSMDIYHYTIEKLQNLEWKQFLPINHSLSFSPIDSPNDDIHNTNSLEPNFRTNREKTFSCCDITKQNQQFYCNWCGRAVIEQNPIIPVFVDE